MLDVNADGLTFQQWYLRADRVVQDIASVGIADLPDGNSNDAWLNNATPRDYAVMMLEEDGFPFDPAPSPSPSWLGTSTALPRNPNPTADRYNGSSLLPEFYIEEIVLESGETILIERKSAASGYARVIKPSNPQPKV